MFNRGSINSKILSIIVVFAVIAVSFAAYIEKPEKAEAAFTFVNSGENGDTTPADTTVQATVTGVHAGDLVVILAKWENGDTTVSASDGTSSFTDALAGNHAVGTAGAGEPNVTALYLLSSVASGSVTYTVTWGASKPFKDVIVAVYTPGSGTLSLDGTSNKNVGAGTSLTTGNITTSGTDGIAFAGYGEYGSALSSEQINNLAADRIITGGSANRSEIWVKSYTSGFTGQGTATIASNNWAAAILAFKLTAGGGGGGSSGIPHAAVRGGGDVTASSTRAFTETFNANGVWTAPRGVTSVQVEAWGGGGGGGAARTGAAGSGGGGAGGVYVRKVFPVTPGQSYTVTVGAAGTAATGANGGTGGASCFSSCSSSGVLALGGNGGQSYANGFQGGTSSTTNSVGDVIFAGGKGGNAGAFAGSGAGGSGASDLSTGNAGGNGSSGVAGASGGTTTGSNAAHNGGAGAAGKIGNGTVGGTGTAPGGAGSGGSRGNTGSGATAGGPGSVGQVILSWSPGSVKLRGGGSSGGGGSVTRVQGNRGTNLDNSAGPISLDFSSDVTVGDLVVVCFGTYESTDNTPPVLGDISQSAGTATIGSWTLDSVKNQQYGSEYIGSAIFSAPVTGTGSLTVSIGGGGSSHYWSISLAEYSGVDVSANRVDTTATGGGTTGTGGSTNTFSTTGSTLINGCATTDAGGPQQLTKGSNYSLVFSNNVAIPINHEEWISTGSQTNIVADWTWPSSFGWAATAVSYKVASSGGTSGSVKFR